MTAPLPLGEDVTLQVESQCHVGAEDVVQGSLLGLHALALRLEGKGS